MDNDAAILQPIAVLAAWTMVMWMWMYATRLPAIRRSTLDLPNWVGGTGSDLDRELDARTQWKAHNYNHLHEAPTVFYAVSLVLAVMGQGWGFNATVAWVYVGARIAHSIWQATVNRVTIRFALFLVSSLALMMLVVHTCVAVFTGIRTA